MKLRIGIFSIITLIIIAITAQTLIRVYYYRDFATFTSEEEILEAKTDAFGWFAQFL